MVGVMLHRNSTKQECDNSTHSKTIAHEIGHVGNEGDECRFDGVIEVQGRVFE